MTTAQWVDGQVCSPPLRMRTGHGAMGHGVDHPSRLALRRQTADTLACAAGLGPSLL